MGLQVGTGCVGAQRVNGGGGVEGRDGEGVSGGSLGEEEGEEWMDEGLEGEREREREVVEA